MSTLTPQERASHADMLRVMIRVNEMLPAERRCNDFIAAMKEEPAGLERPRIKLVVNRDND